MYEGIVLQLCITCVFSKWEIDRETVRENRGYYSGSAVGFCLFILLDNRKEGLAVRGGCIPNWVNHVYLCLFTFMFFMFLYFPYILCVALLHNI